MCTGNWEHSCFKLVVLFAGKFSKQHWRNIAEARVASLAVVKTFDVFLYCCSRIGAGLPTSTLALRPVLLFLREALACILLSASQVLQLVNFTKPEWPKKSGYLGCSSPGTVTPKATPLLDSYDSYDSYD